MTDAPANAYLGIDIGSISTKGVIVDADRAIMARSYLWTEGNPTDAARRVVADLGAQIDRDAVRVRAVGTTGSARRLVGAMCGATVVKNEITAHAVGTTFLHPDVRTILEIGGQDSKIICVESGIAVDYAMNTLCAAGTGAFLSSQAHRLGVEVEEFGDIALTSKKPANIAARCTVFAESDLVHKIQVGYAREDIIAGLCRAVATNYLNNVGKGKQIAAPVVFQGGVSKNAGVVQAFRDELGMDVVVDEDGHLMGAFGVALLAAVPRGLPKPVLPDLTALPFTEALVEYGRPPHFDTVGDGKVYEKFKDGSDPYNYPNTDWYDLAYRTGIQHSHNMNVSGGTDYLKYLMSIGYLKQEGTLPNAARQQFNGRTNLDVKLNSRLNVHVNMAYINNDYTDPNSSYGEDGSEQIVMRLGKMAPWIVARYEDGTWGTISDGSPIAWLDVDQTVRRENQNFSGILSADYTLFNGLVATLTGAYVNNRQHYKAFRKFIQYNPNKKSDPNRLNENYYGWHRATFDVLLNYDKRFGRHGLKTLAGWHTEKYTYNESKAERSNFPNNDLTDMNAGDAATVKNSGYSRELAMISWFGRVNYDYAGKYLFEANIRADASSRFAKGHRWGYFPSFSAAWRISEEAFMEEAVGWLTDLKIRGSYGNLGNQSALSDFYPWMNSYDLDAHYSLNGSLQTGYHQKNYKIATISWEKARTWGVGIDATLFGKLTVGLDYYDRKTTGIIMDVPVPAEFGLGAYKDNVGAMVNRGVELTLNYNESWDDWSFGVSANLAYNKNKVLYLDGVQSLADGDLKVKQVGAAYGTYRLYKTGGFFQSDEEAKRWQEKHKNDAGYPFKRDFKAGDLIYMDTNEDGLINADDRVLCGSSNPSYTFGLNLSAGYKSIDCSVMLTGVADVKRMIDINGFGGEWSGDDCHPNNIWLDAWTPDNRDAKMPRIAVGKTSNNLEYSDFWLQDGSYLRLKNLQLGYTLPKKILKSMGVENLRVYYSGENLLTFHKMMVEADPELGNLYGFPINRSHAFGVNITF